MIFQTHSEDVLLIVSRTFQDTFRTPSVLVDASEMTGIGLVMFVQRERERIRNINSVNLTLSDFHSLRSLK